MQTVNVNYEYRHPYVKRGIHTRLDLKSGFPLSSLEPMGFLFWILFHSLEKKSAKSELYTLPNPTSSISQIESANQVTSTLLFGVWLVGAAWSSASIKWDP